MNCGQTDDHPKLHYGDQTYHHDCLPAPIEEEIRAGLAADMSLLVSVIDTCKGGLRGPDLLAHIQAMHAEVPTDE